MKYKLLEQIWYMTKLVFYGTVIQCFMLTILLAADINAQRKSIDEIYLDINLNNSSVKHAFKVIEKETGLYFAFSDSSIDKGIKIDYSSNGASLRNVLRYLSKNSGLQFKRVNETINVSKKTGNTEAVTEIITPQSQTREITGKVVTSEDDSGLPGVNVIIQGTSTGTVTDVEGNYKIDIPEEGARLEFSSVGYLKEIVEVGTRSIINISLAPDITQLSEIVVIGYGTREKKDLTGAVSFMDSKDIEKSNFMGADMAMQGQMAGVLVQTTSGNPQDRPNILIRGQNTWNRTQPLYVIDGIPITEFGSGFEGGGTEGARARDIQGPVNILTLINPADIESISVLKDASAAAIYGVRAAAGVVLITTKKGSQGKAKIDFNYRTGIKNIPNKPSLLNVPQYTQLYQESHLNRPDIINQMPLVFNPSDTVARGPYDAYLGGRPTIDWQTPMINKNARLTDIGAKIYGGTEGADYYLGTGYSYQEGPFINNFMERYSLSGNLNARAGKHFEAGTTFRLTYMESLDQSPGFDNARSAPPWQPLTLKDDYYSGNIPDEINNYGYATTIDTTSSPNPIHPNFGGSGQSDLTPIYNMTNTRKYGPESASNYLARNDTKLYERKYQYYRAIGSVFAAVKFLDGFKLKGSYSFDWYYQRRNQWTSINRGWFGETTANFWDAGDKSGTTKGEYGERHIRNYNLTGEITLNYNKSFGDHNLDVILGFMDQQYGMQMASAGSGQIPIDDPDRRYVIEATSYTNKGGTDYYNGALQGYIGRISYNYAGKYYADATVRRDGSFRFSPDYRWGTFPSVALAWRMSSENFMDGVPWLNDLKIRGGWGQLGNQDTRDFAYLSLINDNPQYSFGSVSGAGGIGSVLNGITLPDFPVEDLSWETTTTTNIGFDAILLRNRLNVTIEWYNKLTTDILQSAELAPTVGNGIDPILNLAKVRNNGFEFQFGWNDNIGDVGYFVNANFTTVNNEVLEVYNDQPFGGNSGRIEVGYPMHYLYGYKIGGIFQNQAEVTAYQAEYEDQLANSALVSPGDMWFQDLRGPANDEERFYSETPDGVVNTNDRVYIGNTIPEYFYGLNLGVSWKGFDIAFFFQGIGGLDKYNWELAGGVAMSGMGNNQWTNTLNRWTPSNMNVWDPNNKANSLPRAVRNDPGSNNRFSNRFVESASYMKLRDITLGYTLPSEMLTNINWLERLRIYVSGQNLWTVTNWSGIDPENNNIPIPIVLSTGLNVTF